MYVSQSYPFKMLRQKDIAIQSPIRVREWIVQRKHCETVHFRPRLFACCISVFDQYKQNKV